MSTFASTRSLTLLSHDITNLRVVLASASPRRRELLSLTGLREGVHFEVSPSTFAEDLAKEDFASPAEYTLAAAPHFLNLKGSKGAPPATQRRAQRLLAARLHAAHAAAAHVASHLTLADALAL